MFLYKVMIVQGCFHAHATMIRMHYRRYRGQIFIFFSKYPTIPDCNKYIHLPSYVYYHNGIEE